MTPQSEGQVDLLSERHQDPLPECQVALLQEEHQGQLPVGQQPPFLAGEGAVPQFPPPLNQQVRTASAGYQAEEEGEQAGKPLLMGQM